MLASQHPDIPRGSRWHVGCVHQQLGRPQQLDRPAKPETGATGAAAPSSRVRELSLEGGWGALLGPSPAGSAKVEQAEVPLCSTRGGTPTQPPRLLRSPGSPDVHNGQHSVRWGPPSPSTPLQAGLASQLHLNPGAVRAETLPRPECE